MPSSRNPDRSPRNALVAGDPVAIEIASFLRHLESCFRARQRRSLRSSDAPDENRGVFSLELSIASVDRDLLHQAAPDLPPQIGLLGPTQAGKSSLTNWLLGVTRAGVSPLAGYTIHPQGFCWGPDHDRLAEDLAPFFRGLERVEAEALSREHLDRYTLSPAAATLPTGLAPSGCIWDTPDFDSVDSDIYRSQVLRIAALVDLAILVVSKDKYADQTVWDMLELLEALHQPVLVVINKIEPQASELVVSSFHEKWRAVRRDHSPETTTIPFTAGMSEAATPAAVEALLTTLRNRLASPERLRNDRRRQTRGLVERFWSEWLTPVRAEQDAQAEWHTEIDAAMKEAVERYTLDYLDHPQHYETFQLALARLLTLLEVPGVGGALAKARRALTWPFRQVSGLGRGKHRGEADDEAMTTEEALLLQIGEHVLLRLHRIAVARRDAENGAQDWWGDVAELLRQSRAGLQAPFSAALRSYLRSFQPEVESTARDLYQRLEERPVVLNSLRATRFTTDAAALALALHSGGIGMQDFVIAPATLAVTSMLTESALGRYVDRAADHLKRRQLAAVIAFLDDALRRPLGALPDQLDPARHFRVSRERVGRIEDLLKAYV